MTWLWHTSSSWLCAAAALAAPVSGTVHLTDSQNPGVHKHKDHSGAVVRLEPAAPTGAAAALVSGTVRLTDSQNPGVRKHKDYSGVVVWLEPAAPTGAALSRPVMHARMEQRGKEFVPHVLAIPAGSTVNFPNLDPVFHNAFSEFAGQVFDLGLYAPGTSRAITFARSGIMRVFCNIHPTMSAVIAVMKYSWFAVSGASGDFRILDVPPGEYVLHVYHERAAEQVLRALDRKVVVPPGGLALGPIAISETGYVETPHKDKYGQDYAPVVDDELYKR